MPESSLSPGNVNEVIESAIALYEGKQDIAIDSRLQANIPAVLLDTSQLKRVFINLIDNAVDSMNEEGTISIESRQDSRAGRIEIHIRDEGRGVSAKDKSKLFLPYFSTKGRGSGLGLAICSRIISDHDGSIRVDDNRPRGTVFTIELPIAPGEQDLSEEGIE